MLLIPGESPKTEQTLLGHSRLGITMDIYAHTAPEMETNAVAELTTPSQGGRFRLQSGCCQKA
jgi:hypothetical protein